MKIRRSLRAFERKNIKRGKSKRPLVPYYFTLADLILDSVVNKPGTIYYKVRLPDGTMVYHAGYDNGSNTKRASTSPMIRPRQISRTTPQD